MLAAARYVTLLWPGMPWLWLRGNVGGLVLALAFAVVLDLAIVGTWVYSEFFNLQVSLGLWAAAGAVWLVATVSAVSASASDRSDQKHRERGAVRKRAAPLLCVARSSAECGDQPRILDAGRGFHPGCR